MKNQQKININQNHAESCGRQPLRISHCLNKIQSILRSRCSESQPLSINAETLNNNLSGWTLLYQGGANFMTATSNDRKAGGPELQHLRTTTLCNTKAFTLIELLVVVLIIGILAAIALPQYQKAVDKTHFNSMLSVLRSLAEAKKVYFLANGEHARSFSVLDVQLPSSCKTIAPSDWYGELTQCDKYLIYLDPKNTHQVAGRMDFSSCHIWVYFSTNNLKNTCYVYDSNKCEHLCQSLSSDRPATTYDEEGNPNARGYTF